MDSKFDNVSPGCYRITIGFNDGTSLIKDFQTRGSRDAAWEQLDIAEMRRTGKAVICDDRDNMVMLSPDNIKYIRMSVADPEDARFGKTRLIGPEDVTTDRTSVDRCDWEDDESFDDDEENGLDDDEVCNENYPRSNLVDEAEELLYLGHIESALILLNSYLSDEGRDDSRAIHLRNMIVHGDRTCNNVPKDIVKDSCELPEDDDEDFEDETIDDPEMRCEMMPYKVTVKLLDGTRFFRDFHSMTEANSAVDSLYFFARHKEGNIMNMHSRDGRYQFSPYAVSHISCEPSDSSKPCWDWTRIDGESGDQRIPRRRLMTVPRPGISVNPTGVVPVFTVIHRR